MGVIRDFGLGLGQLGKGEMATSMGKPVRVYNHNNERVTVDVQVDLV